MNTCKSSSPSLNISNIWSNSLSWSLICCSASCCCFVMSFSTCPAPNNPLPANSFLSFCSIPSSTIHSSYSLSLNCFFLTQMLLLSYNPQSHHPHLVLSSDPIQTYCSSDSHCLYKIESIWFVYPKQRDHFLFLLFLQQWISIQFSEDPDLLSFYIHALKCLSCFGPPTWKILLSILSYAYIYLHSLLWFEFSEHLEPSLHFYPSPSIPIPA